MSTADALTKLTTADGVPVVDQLREILASNYQTVQYVFREWDDDDSGTISAAEFRRAIPALGVAVDVADANALFALLDADGSGELDYNELNRHLRRGADVALDEALQDGAMGEIQLKAENEFALRSGLDPTKNTMFGSDITFSADSDVPVIEQLKRALEKRMARVIDIFRVWDEDFSGTVSKREFARSLPMLGIHVPRAQA